MLELSVMNFNQLIEFVDQKNVSCIAKFMAVTSEWPTFICAVCNWCLFRTNF